MSLIPFLAGALMVGQPITSIPGPDIRITELRDVAYEELATGQTEAALGLIQAELATRPGDPALLINLGSTYLRLGRVAEAQAAFAAAEASGTRYDLELADGRWVDSRRAARLAQADLATRPMLALR
jgi:thioredoxin-like negative regulator of GroEL